jgi:hypothetical protein
MSLSCHLVADPGRDDATLLTDAYRTLGAAFGIDHATLQVESADFAHESPRSVCGSCDDAAVAAGGRR